MAKQETQKPKASHHDQKKKKSKKSWLKWVGIGAVVIIAFIVLGFYQDQKAMEERRAVAEKQRQVMVDHWTSQGLTQEEVAQKLQEEGKQRMEGFEPSIFQQVMRTVRHATGNTGPGGGAGGGRGMGGRQPR